MTTDGNTSPIEQSAFYNNSVTVVTTINRWFTNEECDSAIALANFIQEGDGTTGAEKIVSKTRNSQTRFIEPSQESGWLYQKLEATLIKLNESYRFNLSGIEAVQIARYSAGGYYNWHMDLGAHANSLRKLSLSVQLSDAQDYQGGELEFMNVPPEHNNKERGALIVFPSFMMHRVNAVTSGTRLSMVAWVTGAPFA